MEVLKSENEHGARRLTPGNISVHFPCHHATVGSFDFEASVTLGHFRAGLRSNQTAFLGYRGSSTRR
jgi:hypothetical protein